MPRSTEREGKYRTVPDWESRLTVAYETMGFDKEAGMKELFDLGRAVVKKHRVSGIYGKYDISPGLESACELGFDEMLVIYISFVGLNGSVEALQEYQNMLTNLSNRIDVEVEMGGLTERDVWLSSMLFEAMRARLEKMRAEELSGEVAYVCESILEKCPQLGMSMAGLLSDMMRSSFWKEKENSLDCIAAGYSVGEACCFVSEYFRDPGEQDTFFADKAIEVVERTLARDFSANKREASKWELIDEESREALLLSLRSIIDSLRVAFERGHERYVLGGLFRLVRRYTELAELIDDRTLSLLEDYRESIEVEEDEGGDRAGSLIRYKQGKYRFLNTLFDDLPTADQGRILDILERGRKADEVALLRNVFSTNETYHLVEANFFDEEEKKDLVRCLSKNRFVMELMLLMAEREGFEYQMGVLLSVLDFSELPARLKEKIDPVWIESDQELILKRHQWSLCESAEERMVDAMYTGAVMLLNESLLVKFKGKMSGLCLRTFATKKGFTFVKGNWYSPVDARVRNKLKEAYFGGKDAVEILESSEWVLMRRMTGIGERAPEELVKEAERLAGKINSTGRGRKYAERDYRYLVCQEDD